MSSSFVIVTYKPNLKYINDLLTVLPSFSIIIDNSSELKQNEVSGATLLSPQSNTGYAGGANVGIRHALAHNAQWIVVLNQDTVMTKKAVMSLVKYLSKSKPGIYGPYAGGLDPQRWTTIMPSMKAEYISGCCIAIHRDVIAKIGYFFEPYFMYYEEVDYCIRAQRANFPVKLALIEGISHEESVSLGRGSLLHQYYLARNHLLFVSRLAPPRVRRREYLRLPFTMMEHIMRHEYGAFLGVCDFLFHRFGRRGRDV